MNQRVVITGVGVVCSIGQNIDEFWSNCLDGHTVVKTIPEHWFNFANFNSNIWSPLPELDIPNSIISRIEQKQTDMSSQIAVISTIQALDTAGLEYDKLNEKRNTFYIKNIDNEKCGVSFGTGVGGISTLASCNANQILSKQKEKLNNIKQNLREDLDKNNDLLEEFTSIQDNMIFPKRFNPFAVSMIMPNACAANLGIKFNLKRYNRTFCAACASGSIAIGNGFNAIRSGELDIALVGGTEYFYDDYGALYYGFDTVKTLAHGHDNINKANRPFDKKRTGFLFGQGGSAVLIIESLEHAKKRGADIIAEISGYGETCDAHNIMMMESSGEQIKNAIKHCLDDANIKPKDIDYINTHGTGTMLNDETESKIIEELFKNKPLLNSTKSLIGHTLGASGAIEAVVTALSIKNKTTHVSKNIDDPIRDLNFVKKVEHCPIKTALSQSFGFGGHNSILAIKEMN